MTDCLHPDFVAFVDVARIIPEGQVEGPDTAAIGFVVEVKVHCSVCAEEFVFHGAGLPVGVLDRRPTISFDGLELRCPIRPQSGDPHFGLGLPGFVARVHESDAGSTN